MHLTLPAAFAFAYTADSSDSEKERMVGAVLGAGKNDARLHNLHTNLPGGLDGHSTAPKEAHSQQQVTMSTAEKWHYDEDEKIVVWMHNEDTEWESHVIENCPCALLLYRKGAGFAGRTKATKLASTNSLCWWCYCSCWASIDACRCPCLCLQCMCFARASALVHRTLVTSTSSSKWLPLFLHLPVKSYYVFLLKFYSSSFRSFRDIL